MPHDGDIERDGGGSEMMAPEAGDDERDDDAATRRPTPATRGRPRDRARTNARRTEREPPSPLRDEAPRPRLRRPTPSPTARIERDAETVERRRRRRPSRRCAGRPASGCERGDRLPDAGDGRSRRRRQTAREDGGNITEVNGNGAGGEEEVIESVGGADAMEEVPERMPRLAPAVQDPGGDQAPAGDAGAGGQGRARHQGRGAHHLSLARRPLFGADAEHRARRRHQPQDHRAPRTAAGSRRSRRNSKCRKAWA